MPDPVLIVCGSRDLLNYRFVADRLESAVVGFSAVWSGGCRSGVDSSAHLWCLDSGFPYREFPADWSLGRSAGPRRTSAMLAAAPVGSVLLAFVQGPPSASPGSAFAVREARRLGLPVRFAFLDLSPCPAVAAGLRRSWGSPVASDLLF